MENISLLGSHLNILTLKIYIRSKSRYWTYLRTNWDYVYKISNNFDQIQEYYFLNE